MNGSMSPPGTFVLRRGLERLRASAMLKQSLLVFSGGMVLNLCNFIAHAVASRELGVIVYGGLYALINAALIAALPAAFVGPVVAQLSAEFRALHDDGHLRGLTESVAEAFARLGLLYMVIAAFAAIPFSWFLHVPVWSAQFVGLIAGAALYLSALRAVAQGTQDFVGFALSNSFEGIAKVVGIGVLLAVGLKLGGGIIGFFLGPLCALVYLGVRLRKRYSVAESRSVRYDWRRILNASAGSAAATISLALIGSADVVLVKHYFDPHDAGLYAAAALGGKMLLYLVGFIPTVLLPQAADRHARGAQTREVLAGSLLMFFIVAAFGLFVFRYFGLTVLHALVGHAFDAASPLLVTYGLAMVLLALTNALSYYGIATHRLAFTVPLLTCTIGTLAAIVAFHPNLSTVVEILVVGNAVGTLAVTVALVAQQNTSGRRSTV
jgi:O-antigen/teichoic acid export membrane protein